MFEERNLTMRPSDHWFRYCRPGGSKEAEEEIVFLEERLLFVTERIEEIERQIEEVQALNR